MVYVKPSPERDAEIQARYRAGEDVWDIADRYGLSDQRIKQIVRPAVPAMDKWREYRLRDDAIMGWYLTGMSTSEIGERYGICRGRVWQIMEMHRMREGWRKQRKPPKRVLARALPPQGLDMKPGAIWHTWYLDPNRRTE